MVKQNEKNKNPKGAGRKQKFSEEELLHIIDSFLINEYKHEINATILAKYAKEKLNYGDIRYYHFTQKEKVLKKIEDISKQRKRKFVSDSLQSFQSITIDVFVDKYYNNKPMLKQTLCEVQLGQKEMYKKMIMKDTENRELISKLKAFESEIQEIKESNKNLQKRCTDADDRIRTLSKLIEVDNQIKLLKSGWDLTNIEPNNLYAQYILILKTCGLITESQADEINFDSSSENLKESEISVENVVKLFKNQMQKNSEEFTNEEDDDDTIPDIQDELDELLGSNE